MKILKDKTITDVPGFSAIGIHSGAKKSGKKDMCIIYSENPAVAAATLTTNKAKAAPVVVTQDHIKSQYVQAIVVNSGNANACTGKEGIKNAYRMAEAVGGTLGISPSKVLVGSTGVIGVPLPMDIIIPGIKKACQLVHQGEGISAAQAILTTDTFVKTKTVEVTIGGKPIMISGMAKGSGMIHPNMATMLSFVVTNASVSKELLSTVFKESVEDSYNMISVDGDSSTNDMAIILANGTEKSNAIDDNPQDLDKFKRALNFINQELAKMIAKDGEGATTFIEVSLHHGRSKEDARILAKEVISSNLVKTAIFGSDANWGRIMCALGYAKAKCDLNKVDIFFKNDRGQEQLVKNGVGLPFDEKKAKEILDQSYINIVIDVKEGDFHAKAWGCDLTYDYIKINGSYRS